jgi:hypothetical protein
MLRKHLDYTKAGFLPNPFQFISCVSFSCRTLKSPATDSLNKSQTQRKNKAYGNFLGFNSLKDDDRTSFAVAAGSQLVSIGV